jgi:hypothetical protein
MIFCTERTAFHLPDPAGSLAGASKKRLDIGGELGVMLAQGVRPCSRAWKYAAYQSHQLCGAWLLS